MDPVAVAQTGEQLFTAKLLLTAMQYMWIYDYLLTVRDEINYAWSGRRSWVFALFILNRYTPLVHFFWVQVTMFHYNTPFCEATKWVPAFHSIAGTIFAHTAVALRIYAITRMNKVIGGTLGLVLAAEIANAFYCVMRSALGPLEPLPEINLDPFEICIFAMWLPGETLYYSLMMFFESLSFAIIVFTVWRSRMIGHSSVPSILDSILQDATLYFLFIFSAHFVSLLFLFVTPANVQPMPAMANTTFVPLMASRLMLSLKKAADEPREMWSLGTMTNPGWSGTARFASRAPDELQEISLVSVTLDKEGKVFDAAGPSTGTSGPSQAL